MYALKVLFSTTVEAFAWAGLWAWKLLTAPFRLLWLFVKSLGLAIAATPGILWRLPVRAYRRMMRVRDWILVKVEFLQAESAKWKTTFAIVKSPFTLLTKMGFSPQMATSLLIGASAVGGGVVVNETVFAERSFARGDSGTYSAPSDIPTSWSEGDNTLRIKLGTTPVKAVTISDVSVNSFTGSSLPSGSTLTIDIGGSAAVNTWLEVGTLLFERNRCEALKLSNINTHTLNVTSNCADGQSLSPAAGSSPPRAITGGHGMARDMRTTGGLYDKVVIESPTSGVNGQIDTLVLSNLYSKNGPCRINRVKASEVTINLNRIGGDSDLSTKAFIIMDDVTASVINLSDNVEVSMAVPATQTIDQ